eukprot:scaffold117240_cov14-Tisochrysis_lutea.AAC.1
MQLFLSISCQQGRGGVLQQPARVPGGCEPVRHCQPGTPPQHPPSGTHKSNAAGMLFLQHQSLLVGHYCACLHPPSPPGGTHMSNGVGMHLN